MTPATLQSPADTKAVTLQQPEYEPSLLDPCTCRRDGAPCKVCKLWDLHLGWLEGKPTQKDSVGGEL